MAAGRNYLKSDLYQSFMKGSLSVNQGMMTENLAAQALSASDVPLRFFERTVCHGEGTKKYEVDFLIVVNGKVIPLEVKSGNQRTHASLDYYCQTYKKQTGKGMILMKGDLRVTEDYRYIPLPMAWFLLE